MKFGLQSSDIEKIRKTILTNEHVEKIIIYGSRAKGNFKKGSDIDLIVTGEKIQFQDVSKIELALDDLMLPYKIDLSRLEDITYPDLREHIERVGVEFVNGN